MALAGVGTVILNTLPDIDVFPYAAVLPAEEAALADLLIATVNATLHAGAAVDFERKVCDRNKLAVWFAFWGESKSRPTYRKICAERDRAYRSEMIEVCQSLIDAGRYSNIDAESVAAGLSAMTAGLWLDMLTNPRSMSREDGRAICRQFLAATFNRHFMPAAEASGAGRRKAS